MSALKLRLALVPNLRFWTFENGGWVKLTLKPGQTLEWGKSEPTDEGWSSLTNRWEHCGEEVTWEWHSDGRDCDGRLERGGSLVAKREDLALVPAFSDREHWEFDPEVLYQGRRIMRPEWEKLGKSWQRDHTAEAAGY